MLPFSEAAIEPAACQPPQPRPARAFGIRGTAAPHIIAETAEAGLDAELAEIEAENGAEDHLADDPEDDPEDDPDDEADADAAVGDPLRYLPPLAAAKWLRANGIDIDIAGLRSGRLGGWRVRYDQLTQWAAFRFGLELSEG